MAGFAAAAPTVAGGVSSVSGLAGQLIGQRQSRRAASHLRQQADAEADSIITGADLQAEDVTRNAFAALFDAGLAGEQGAANERVIRRAGRRAEAEVTAAAAGSGLDAVGSPLLLEAEVAFEAEREAEQSALTTQFAIDRLTTESTEGFRRADLTRQAGRIEAAGVRGRAASQAAHIRARAGSVFDVTRAASGLVFRNRDLFNTVLTKRTTPKPAEPIGGQIF